jgi:hypothetical protein
MNKTFSRPLALITLGAASLVFNAAQAQAPAATDMIAAPTCEQVHYPGRTAPEKQMNQFNKQLAAYQKCMNEYIDGQKKAAEANVEEQKKYVDELNALTAKQSELKNKIALAVDKQKRHVEARNLAVGEFNTLMTKLKKDAGQ